MHAVMGYVTDTHTQIRVRQRIVRRVFFDGNGIERRSPVFVHVKKLQHARNRSNVLYSLHIQYSTVHKVHNLIKFLTVNRRR